MSKVSNAAMRLYSRIIRNPDFPASKMDREAASWLRDGWKTWTSFARAFPAQFLRLLLALEHGSDDHCDALDACDEAYFFLPEYCYIDPPKALLSATSWGEIYDALRESGEDLARIGIVTDMLDYLRAVILASKRIDNKEAMKRAWEKMRVQLNYIEPAAAPEATAPDLDITIDKALDTTGQKGGKKKTAEKGKRGKPSTAPIPTQEPEPAVTSETRVAPSQPDSYADGFAFGNQH